MEIVWTESAIYDLDGIISYLNSNWLIKVLLDFEEKLESTLSFIVKNPYSFQISQKLSYTSKYVMSKHNTIYFKSSNNQIEIIRLFDTRQSPDKLI
jgi:plasmid stabilization system protein ParE